MNKKLLLIGLAVLHFSAANLIIASSSSTTSSSDKPKRSYCAPAKLLCLLCKDNPAPFSADGFHKHMWSAHEPLPCPRCSTAPTDLSNLVAHLQAVHKERHSRITWADIVVAQGLAAHAPAVEKTAKKTTTRKGQQAAAPASTFLPDTVDTRMHEAQAQNPTHQAAEIPSTIAPHIPSLDAQVSSGFDASDKKYCNCANNSPSCIQCHLSETYKEEDDDLVELLKQAAANLPEPQSSPDQTAESLLGKHAREESDDATKLGPDQAQKITKFSCDLCQLILRDRGSMYRHVNTQHSKEPEEKTFSSIEVEATPEELALDKSSKAKNAARTKKNRDKTNAEWNFQCKHCAKIITRIDNTLQHTKRHREIPEDRRALKLNFERIPK